MTETTGTDVVREAVRARQRKTNTAGLARDLGIASAALDAFANGRADLAGDVLQALTKHLFGGNVELDPATDRLRSSNKTPPRTMGNPPPSKPIKRPGWA